MLADPPLPQVFTLADARRFGLTPEQAEQRVRTGRWRRLGRGVYCSGAKWAAATPEGRNVLLAHAVAARRKSDERYAFSHGTAAALRELPVPMRELNRVALTVPAGRGIAPRRDALVRQHIAGLPAPDVTKVGDLPATTIDRTLADCLRRFDAVDAVPIGDAALGAGIATKDSIRAALARQSHWPRAASAALVVPMLDGRRETPLESRSAVVMARHGIPAPRVQVNVYDEQGRFVARVDFAWLERGVVGEADGRVKYQGADAAGAIRAEKDRQARLEALGLIVVRWDDRALVGDPPPLARRLTVGLARGDGRRFTGRAA